MAQQNYIGGTFVDAASGATDQVVNPASGEVIAEVPSSTAADVDAAVGAARAAFGDWAATTPRARSEILHKVADAIEADLETIQKLEIDNVGKPVSIIEFEMDLTVDNWRFFAAGARFLEGRAAGEYLEEHTSFLRRDPVGVVASIAPWNYPINMATWKLGPALAMGNTVVLKPAMETPATAMEFAKAINDAGIFPPGVVNILPGGAEAGRAMTLSPIADKVAFTGSTVVGKEIMEGAAKTLKRVTLELGGKSANIVLEDADLDSAIDAALWATFFHAGQACESGTRLFLPETLHDDVLSKIVEKTKKIRLGDPKQMTSDVGPVVSKRQYERVLGYIEKGKKEGARCAVGGKAATGPGLEKGFYIEPTIFADVKNDMTIAREEIFGPVLCVLKYKTVQEAVELANQSSYGLGGAVWSKDLPKAMDVARQIRTGTVWINEYHMLNVTAPFGGYKQSGIGREFGSEGLEAYVETKTIYMDLVGKREKKVWYDMIARRG